MATLAPKLPYTHPFAGGYPYRGSARLPSDPDALTYLAAVAAADGAPVEVGVATAVDDFFKGCKADGTFGAWKAACLLCGARTLAGALVPLAGDAPTNNNFVDADYNRETGLVGNGSTKYLDSNRDSSDDPQDDCHLSVYETQTHVGAAFGASIGGFDTVAPSQKVIFYRDLTLQIVGRLNNQDATSFTRPSATTGFTGVSRSNGSGLTLRYGGSDNEIAQASVAMANRNISVYSQDIGGSQSNYCNARMAFYSIGTAISDLALLDARVTALVTAIGAAI
jgi:hypothetical protein